MFLKYGLRRSDKRKAPPSRYVNTVRTIEGKVWHANSPASVIVSLPDGTNQIYKVPSHAKFTVNGEPKSVFELKRGMNFKALSSSR